MSLWINIIFAWIALILTFLLVVIWGLRLIGKRKSSRRSATSPGAPIRLHHGVPQRVGKTASGKHAAAKAPHPKPLAIVNRWLRRHHKLIGILLIATGAVHGLFSSDTLWSLNLGTVTWIVSILLGISWMLRKKLKKAWMTAHRLLTVAFVALLVIHILNVGGFILDDMIAGRVAGPPDITQQVPTEIPSDDAVQTAQATPDETDDVSADTIPDATETPDVTQPTTDVTQPTTDVQTSQYIDGTYYGTGNGYRPGLVVEVVIENGQIASVTVTEHNERDERYWGYPATVIPEEIIAAQSTDVDSISGATMTSEGIKEAVDDALSQALAG